MFLDDAAFQLQVVRLLLLAKPRNISTVVVLAGALKSSVGCYSRIVDVSKSTKCGTVSQLCAKPQILYQAKRPCYRERLH